MYKTALSTCIGPRGEQNWVSPDHQRIIDGASEYMATANHYMKNDVTGGGRLSTDSTLYRDGKSAELKLALRKVANARTHADRVAWTKHAADFMGNTNDGELEQAIFTLSSHFIREKAPKLFDLNYFVGFRVLDKSDDNTRVVGIYGFKVGKSWVYIPVFFDKGKLNGYELCYLEAKDQFVPLKEGWVDWIIKNAGDEALGSADDKDIKQLGVRYPSMTQLTQPPILGKTAAVFNKLAGMTAHLEPWVRQGVLCLSRCSDLTKVDADLFNLEKIGSADPTVFARLAVTCETYPLLKVAMQAFYGDDVMQRMCKRVMQTHVQKTAHRRELASSIRPARPTKRAAVQIITQEDKHYFPYLTEKQAEELVEGPIAVDERASDEVATLEDEIKFCTPDRTGVYDVFCADGTFRECLVVVGAMFSNTRPDREICLVVDWKRRKHIYAKSMAVLCVQGSYKEGWFDRLPADAFRSGTNMHTGSDDTHASSRILIANNGSATIPLDLTHLSDGLWRINSYDSEYEEHRDRTYDINENVNQFFGLSQMLYLNRKTPEDGLGKVKGCRPRWLVCSSQLAGTKFVVRNDKLIAPSKFKFIDVEEGSGAAFPLGDENDIVAMLYKNRKKLRAAKVPGGYALDGEKSDKTAAFKRLVLNYSFRDKVANDILKAVELADGHTLYIPYITPRYKTAELPIDPVFLQNGILSEMGDSTMSPVFNDMPISADGYSGLPIQEGFEDTQQLGFEDQPTPTEFTNELPPPDPMAMQQAAEAAQTGQKNVFDISMLAALLKTNRNDEVLGDYSKTFKLALSHVGRVLFKLYWDRDSFIDRFGEEDMDKFEDLLKDVFSNLGDLVLYLTTKDERPELSDFLDSVGSED